MTHPRPAPHSAHRTLCRLAVLGGLLVAAVAVAGEPAPPADDAKRFAFDKDRIALRDVKDFTPLEVGVTEAGAGRENAALEQLVLHAHQFAADELDNAARRDVSLVDLMDRDPIIRDQRRYELVRVQGLLKRLKRLGSGPTADLKAAGVPDLYEAWVFPTVGLKNTPVCVIVSEYPAGVRPDDNINPGVPVVVSGYFMKIMEYQSSEPNPNDPTRTLYHRAPLLVGRAVLSSAGPPNTLPGVDNLLAVTLAFGVAVAVALLLFAAWLRRSDAGSRKASALRRKNPYPDGEPRPPIWEQPPDPGPPNQS